MPARLDPFASATPSEAEEVRRAVDLDPVVLADRAPIEPGGEVVHGLVGVVDGELGCGRCRPRAWLGSGIRGCR